MAGAAAAGHRQRIYDAVVLKVLGATRRRVLQAYAIEYGLLGVATAVIAAPIALDLATRLQVNPDAFLMAVAVAASCAFLTPIGHKNNTIIMGPGGYRFGDYWRLGAPLELLIVLIAVPLILFFWPL